MEMMNEMAKKEMMDHLKMHVKYPATKKTIMEACNMMAHVPAEARDMVSMHLKDKMYKSADEVMTDIGMAM